MKNKTLGNLLIAIVALTFAIGFLGIEVSESGYMFIGLIMIILAVWSGIRLRKVDKLRIKE